MPNRPHAPQNHCPQDTGHAAPHHTTPPPLPLPSPNPIPTPEHQLQPYPIPPLQHQPPMMHPFPTIDKPSHTVTLTCSQDPPETPIPLPLPTDHLLTITLPPSCILGNQPITPQDHTAHHSNYEDDLSPPTIPPPPQGHRKCKGRLATRLPGTFT